MVGVPEMPEDPALYVRALAAAGYFEGLRVTEEDGVRVQSYRANAERERLKESVTDMASYLESLGMVLTVQPFDRLGLARVTQLINKTNQFNLTTQRLSEVEVAARMDDPRVVALQARLVDRFGDNGVIAVMMARVNGEEAVVEEWLMSCRVLGRRVEEACLNALVEACSASGARRLIGLYRPTKKNTMVRGMYASLGFMRLAEEADGSARWAMELAGFVPRVVPIEVDVMREAMV